MKSIIIKNFKFGLDTRRDVLTSQPGTLVTLQNGQINQGAEIENRKAFVKLGQLPASCFGIETTKDGLVTFGSADGATVTIPAGLTGLMTYQRLRYPYYAIDRVAPEISNHLNPNQTAEPTMTGVVESCAFEGKAFAIASFTPQEDSGLDTMDDYFSGTFYYYDSFPVLNALQGRMDFGDSFYTGGAARNYWVAKLFVYYAQQTALASAFTFNFATSSSVSVDITSPLDAAFSMTISDTTNGQLTTTVQATASAPVAAVGSTVTIFFTKTTAGTKAITVLTAPNVVNGAISGTVDLLSGGTVPFNTSLFQTAKDLVTKIQASNTGYSAQALQAASNVAQVVITAPPSFGSVPNTNNLSITTTNIFVSTTSLANSGSVPSPGTFAFAAGVTASAGSGQVQRLSFNTPSYMVGNYSVDVNYNLVDYTLGAGNLTTTRATTVFYLISGSSGSIGPITFVDGTNLLSSTVVFNTSLQQTAKDIIANIVAKWNATVGQYRYSSGGGSPVLRNENTWLAYLATTTNANGDTVYGVGINAPLGTSFNGTNNLVVTATATLTVGTGPNALGVAIQPLSLTGATSDGTTVMAMGNKVYMARGQQFNFSKLFDATKWEQQDTGAGAVTVSDQYSSPTSIVAFAPYQGRLAVFCRSNIQIWVINADPGLYQQVQNLQNIGTFAKRSVQSIGDLDVLFLSDSGIRSLRVRDSSLNAFVTDVGSPIDQLIVANLAAGSSTTNAAACGIVEPQANRYWLLLNGVIYVLSYFPSLKISAWSTYTPTYVTFLGNPNASPFTYTGLTVGWTYYIFPSPDIGSISDGNGHVVEPNPDGSWVATSTTLRVTVGAGGDFAATALYEMTQFTPVKFVIFGGQVYILDSNNNVYVYGGMDNNTYDGTPVTAELPWLDDKDPVVMKQFQTFSYAASGKWLFEVATDILSGAFDTVINEGTTAAPSVTQDSSFPFNGQETFNGLSTHVKIKATSDIANVGRVVLGCLAVTYKEANNK